MKSVRKAVVLSAALFSLALATVASGATFQGTTEGVFENPTGPSGMVTAGSGTGLFTWGTGFGTLPSSLAFTGVSFDVDADTVFSFGTLDYYNGTIFSGTGADTVDLNVTVYLTSPAGLGANFVFPFELVNTPNIGTDSENADYVNFNAQPMSPGWSCDGVEYTLQLLGFGTIVDGAFSGTSQFHVLEGADASAELIGRFTEVTNPVPEPGTMLLLGSGLLGLAGYGRKRAKK